MSVSGTTTAVPKVHEMVIIHRFFRRELVAVPLLVRGTNGGDNDRARVVGAHLRFVLDSLRVHHTGEDELLWPKLLERAAPSLELVPVSEGCPVEIELGQILGRRVGVVRADESLDDVRLRPR